MTLRQRLNWFALHAVIRQLAGYGARHGDLQGRLIADPAVRADPGAFADEFERIGDVKVVTLDSGHWPQFSQPEAFAARLVQTVR